MQITSLFFLHNLFLPFETLAEINVVRVLISLQPLQRLKKISELLLWDMIVYFL